MDKHEQYRATRTPCQVRTHEPLWQSLLAALLLVGALAAFWLDAALLQALLLGGP